MKRYYLPFVLLALLAGCTSENFNTESLDNEFVSHVTITASDFVMDAATRTSLELTSSGLSFTWAESDVVGIFPNAGDQVKFPMTKGAGTKTANFDGGGWALKGNYTYAAYYPFSKENYERSYTALPISYKGQKQTANNSTAGLGAYDYMVATASTPESGNVTFNFQHIGSVLYLQLTTPDAATFTTLTLSADDAIFIADATVDISNGTLTPTSTSRVILLDLENMAVEAGGVFYAWMLIAPMDASDKTLKVTITTSDYDVYSAEINGKKYETGKAYKLEGLLVKSSNPIFNGHDFVNLGLPSGTLWATMNVGATTPEGYGNYYAWGETKTKTEQGKEDVYIDETYQWLSIVTTVDWENAIETTTKTITKYWDGRDHSGFTGIADNKTVLDAEDDAAAVNWGGSWRMPTIGEWDELTNTDNCTWTWTTLNGVNGYEVKSKVNDKYIFLPAAGGLWGTYPNSQGRDAQYWSSSLSWDQPENADLLLFTSNSLFISNFHRCSGRAVRPVCHP